jgi:hypothetical protein
MQVLQAQQQMPDRRNALVVISEDRIAMFVEQHGLSEVGL